MLIGFTITLGVSYTYMKRIILIALFSLITLHLKSQCNSISKEIWDIVKKENYKGFDTLLMPIEEYRNILHWPKSDETNEMLLRIKDSLKEELISSAKK